MASIWFAESEDAQSQFLLSAGVSWSSEAVEQTFRRRTLTAKVHGLKVLCPLCQLPTQCPLWCRVLESLQTR